MRDTLDSEVGQLLSTEEEREKIQEALSEASDWLDDEGWDSTADVSLLFSSVSLVVFAFPCRTIKLRNIPYSYSQYLTGTTIIDKTVGKVSTFDVFFASLPTPLIQCCAKLNAFRGKF